MAFCIFGSCSKFRDLNFLFRVSGFVLLVPCFRFRDSGVGIPGFGFQVSGSGFRVPCFGIREAPDALHEVDDYRDLRL